MSTSYDRVPYPCHSYAQTHPDHLAVLARLHGMTPADPAKCRYLEIGCGDGGNLLPLAYELPESRFVGMDLAATSIDAGNQHVRDFGLKNLELRAMDLMEVTRGEFGQFDYIVAHGFYSWVPDFVRERLLVLLREMLAPQGIAFVSYNAYPGCHIRHMVREMLLYHTENAPEPKVKIAQGRALLKFLAEGHGSDDDYGTMLKSEAERVLTFDANHFYHDDLAELNQPFYLHEFVAQAGPHDLQYLGDADFSSMHELRYPKQVRDVLTGIGDDWVRKEQYLDFLKCRRFRQTLLCHREVKVEREVPLALMSEFVFSSSARPVDAGAELRDDSLVDFAGEGSLKLRTGHPVAKLCMAFLGLRYPARVSADELRAVVAAALGEAPEPEQIEAVLLEFLKLGTAEAHLSSGRFTTDPGDKPLTSAWARYQTKFGGGITTLRHNTVHVRDEFGLWLLTQLDGTHSMDDIAEGMARTVKAEDGGAVDLPKETAQAREVVADGIRQLAKLGLIERQN